MNCNIFSWAHQVCQYRNASQKFFLQHLKYLFFLCLNLCWFVYKHLSSFPNVSRMTIWFCFVNHSSISGEVFQDAGTHVVLGFVSAKQKGYNVTITRQTLMRAQQPNSSSSQNPTYMRLQGKEDEDQVQASSLSGALETVPEEVGDFFFQFSSISYLVVAEYCKMCAFDA